MGITVLFGVIYTDKILYLCSMKSSDHINVSNFGLTDEPISRLLLVANFKDETKCCEVLQSVAVLLPHVTSETHCMVVRDIVHNIVLNFW